MLTLAILLIFGISVSAPAAGSFGSGFFITTDGYFVTSYHVIENSNRIQIRDTKGTTVDAVVAAQDRVNDLAILKATGSFDALPVLNSRNVKPGARVVTMGFPHPDIQGREPKITDGIISSLTGIGNSPTLFQISVPLQAGNSGGPLVNESGNVVGVVTAKLSSLGVLKRTGDLPQNVNYAIKSNYLLELTSTVEGLELKLLKERTQPFSLPETLWAFLSRSIGLVVTEASDTSGAELRQSAPALPRIWHSLASGSRYSIRLDEPCLQWIQLSNPTLPTWAAAQGEAKRDYLVNKLFVGVGRTIVRNPSTLQTCSLESKFTFTTVTAGRIEGYIQGPSRFEWSSCAGQDNIRLDFVWVPLAE